MVHHAVNARGDAPIQHVEAKRESVLHKYYNNLELMFQVLYYNLILFQILFSLNFELNLHILINFINC